MHVKPESAQLAAPRCTGAQQHPRPWCPLRTTPVGLAHSQLTLHSQRWPATAMDERWGLALAKSHQQTTPVDTPRCQASRRPALPSVERLLPPRRAHIKLHTHRNEHVTHARLLVETESRAHTLALATSGPCFGCPMPTSTVSAHGTGGASHCWPTATSSSELDPRLRHPPSLWLLTVPTVALSAALTQTSPP